MPRISVPDDYPGLLNRKLAREAIRSHMQGAYDLLGKEVEYGLGLFERGYRSSPDSRMRETAFRQLWLFLETLDAIDALLRQGLVAPGQVLARTLLDIGLQLLFLLKRNDERVAMAYLTHRQLERLQEARRYAVGGERRKEIEAEARRTKYLPVDFLDRFRDTTEEARRLQAVLDHPEWVETVAELTRLKNSRRRRLPWYAAFDGPRDLKELAREVEMELWHRVVYRPFSCTTHGAGPDRVFELHEGEWYARPLRHTENWLPLTRISHVITIEVFTGVIQRFRAGEETALSRWLAETVNPILDSSPLGREP